MKQLRTLILLSVLLITTSCAGVLRTAEFDEEGRMTRTLEYRFVYTTAPLQGFPTQQRPPLYPSVVY